MQSYSPGPSWYEAPEEPYDDEQTTEPCEISECSAQTIEDRTCNNCGQYCCQDHSVVDAEEPGYLCSECVDAFTDAQGEIEADDKFMNQVS